MRRKKRKEKIIKKEKIKNDSLFTLIFVSKDLEV